LNLIVYLAAGFFAGAFFVADLSFFGVIAFLAFGFAAFFAPVLAAPVFFGLP